MVVGIFKPSGLLPTLELETCREATPNSILQRHPPPSGLIFFFFFCGEEFTQQDNELKTHLKTLTDLLEDQRRASGPGCHGLSVLYSHMTASPLNIYGVT